jgi:hypothetical protein
MDRIKELIDWAADTPVKMICITVMFVALVAGVSFSTTSCVSSMTKTDEARYKYRAIENESFWNRGDRGHEK